MPDGTIRLLALEDALTFKQIRIEALRAEPAAYASRAEDWEILSLDEWRSRLVEMPVFAAFQNDEPVGIMGPMWQKPSKTERRYAACDPDNRLIAAQPEKNWETELRRVRDLEVRKPAESPSTIEVDPGTFANLADNLHTAWESPNVTMRMRQQLLRTLIADVVVHVDDAVCDVVLTIGMANLACNMLRYVFHEGRRAAG